MSDVNRCKPSLKTHSLRIVLVAVLVVAALACSHKALMRADAPWWEADEDVWDTQAAYTDVSIKSIYIPMRDGVKLAADVYLPAGLPEGTQLPTILVQTRYARSLTYRWPFNRILEGRFHDTIRYMVTRGYAWVYVDSRGTGASFGTRKHPYSEAEIKDGYEVADWITKQPWSDGKIGAWGNSYDGGAALMLASTRHPAVKAVMPRYAMFDAYSEVFFPGGVKLTWLTTVWSALAEALDANQIWEFVGPKARMAVKGITPVDEDADGSMLAEAVHQHQQNGTIAALMEGVTFRDDAVAGMDGATVDGLSPHKRLGDINALDAAFYCYTGWADSAFLLSEIHLFLNLDDPNKKLTIGPWDHGGFNNISTYATKKQPQFSRDEEILRFFDRYLKGIQTGIDREKPVHYYTIGAETWHSADSWPPAGAQPTAFYFGADSRLAQAMPTEAQAADSYDIELNVGTGQRTRWNSLVNLDHKRIHYSNRRLKDLKLMHYATQKLDEDVEVTGHPVVTLFLESSETDATVFVYLEDVDELGRVMYVTEGMLRALHRKQSDAEPPYATPVPYRTFERADAEALVPGKAAKLVFDLYPTSYVFKKGHRIRIAIAGADKDHFAAIPDHDYQIRIHRSRRLASFISLPIMPQRGN